jgi:DNA-directed RNA polymerase specialized sigma24 family protein
MSEKIKSDGFAPAGPGSFRAFLYETARNICFNHNKNRMRLIKPVSEMFTDDELPGIGELVLTNDLGIDYDDINDRIKGITGQLTPDELKLMKLVAERVKYIDIRKEPEFQKYSVDYLMRKVYNIRKKISRKGDKYG